MPDTFPMPTRCGTRTRLKYFSVLPVRTGTFLQEQAESAFQKPCKSSAPTFFFGERCQKGRHPNTRMPGASNLPGPGGSTRRPDGRATAGRKGFVSRSPSDRCPFTVSFLGGGFRYQNRRPKKKATGTLVLTSLLEDLFLFVCMCPTGSSDSTCCQVAHAAQIFPSVHFAMAMIKAS